MTTEPELKWTVRELTPEEVTELENSKAELPSCQGGLDNSVGGLGDDETES